MIEDEELKGKLINEAQTNWAKLDIYKRVCGSEFSYYDGFIDCGLLKEKRIAELEKENAELKEQCSILDKSLVTSTKNNIERQKIIDEIKEQFTRAKEIIEELYNIIPASMSDYAKEPMEHARKFMTEE